MKAIYFDNNASTKIDERVLAAWHRELALAPLNPSSPHRLGRKARAKLLDARATIAAILGVKTPQVLFTSGGTEALNLAIRGLLVGKCGHVISSLSEHACVLNTLRAIKSADLDVSFLSPGPRGTLCAQQLQAARRPDTLCAILMLANNETGAITDLQDICQWAKNAKIPLICDAVCAFGKIPVAFCEEMWALCFGGHKFHGPPGVGVCCLRGDVAVKPQLTGGPQELGQRAGTEDVPAICALAEAFVIAHSELKVNAAQMSHLTQQLWQRLQALPFAVELNASAPRLPNTLNVHFPHIDGQTLVIALDRAGICASFGAACGSGSLEPSKVLLSMGYSRARAASSLRFSLSKFTTEKDVDQCADAVALALQTLRAFTSRE